jgi:hypothetical protein
MFDNTDLKYNNSATPGINFLESIPKFLTIVTSTGHTQFGEYVNGYLDTLKVKITENRVTVKDSSICKYYLGDNFKTLSKGDYKRAIEKISDCLHLPFQLANVTRIDLAQNFIMQHDSNLYYPYLGESQYYKRLEQNNGLYYNNKLRQLLFYGKLQEQKDKRQLIPELYQNRNVLRFELRYKHRLTNQFNQPEITAGLLYDEDFYRNLVKRWKNEYFNIQKINSKLSNMKPTGSTKELIENMALFQILEAGQSQVLNTIKQWQLTGEITKKQAKDHREKIKLLTQKPFDIIGNDLINELNRKVKEAAQNW